MKNWKYTKSGFTVVLLVSLFILTVLLSNGGAKEAAVTALIEKKCTVCHSTERVYGADKTYDEWERTIKKMVRYSDQMNYLNQQEKKNIINFLVNQKRSAR
ncbi:MAG: cytochrome c [Candidatus Electrothrix sp. AU1_5]|nr:cytochrome c [Candidatus Electrothrix gigas]